MNVPQLRAHISNLMREDFSDRVKELERLLNEAVLELEQKESKPPRSDFWDLRVLILKENQSNYNRINNTEVIAAMYCALQLHNVGKPDEIALSCRSGEAYGELVTHLADFKVDDFPQDLRTMCNNFFPAVTSFEFFVKKKRTIVSGDSGEHTDEALMLTARANMHTLIIEIEEVKEKIQSMIDANLPKLRELLMDPLETHADSDADSSSDEESDDEALDEDGRPNKPSPKRRKNFGEMGTTKDTWLQHVSNFGIQCSPGQAVKNTRTREFRGKPERHYVELMGALSTCKAFIIDKKLPVPRAPTFSHGADDEAGLSFKLVCPGEDVNSNTAVTQKMMDEDTKNGTTLVKDYEEMQNLARTFRKKISELVRMYNNEFEFVVRAHDATDRRDYHVNQLSLMQKYAIGQLYLDAIAVNKNPEPAEEAESESEGESEEEYSGSDCSYASEEDASDDDDDDEDDDDDDASGDSDDDDDSDNE